jgi:zinc/manganese transport system permease protein
MSLGAVELSILLPAFAAGVLVTATHVPLGMQVLARGIVFIDLAIAQVAGCGVLLADQLGFEAEGIAVQIAALGAALGGALLLTWTERIWPDVQEAVIGVVFVLGATGSVLLLASNVHGSEHLRDLLVGQILWAQPSRLVWAAVVYAVVLGLWFGARERLGRTGFYALFALAVTVSGQLVGPSYLVFATLQTPASAYAAHDAPPPRCLMGAGSRGLRVGTRAVDGARSAERPGDRLDARGVGACVVRAHGAPIDSASVSR